MAKLTALFAQAMEPIPTSSKSWWKKPPGYVDL
jgi:hypothetical protein